MKRAAAVLLLTIAACAVLISAFYIEHRPAFQKLWQIQHIHAHQSKQGD